jgi:YVTN family beta-propeller protein
MNKIYTLFAAGLLLAQLAPNATAQNFPSNTLPTGRQITPAGTQQNVGSLPMNMILTPDGKYALVSDMGYREYLTCLNTATGKLAQPVTSMPQTPTDGSIIGPPVSRSLLEFGSPHDRDDKTLGLYEGLAVVANGDGTYTAYAAQGAHASIAIIHVSADGSLTQTGAITMRPDDFPAGLSLDAQGHLYVAINTNNDGDSLAATTTPGSMVVYDTKAAGVVMPSASADPAPELARVLFNGAQDTFGKITLPSGTIPFTPNNYPFAVAALSGSPRAFVSSQRDGTVYAVDLSKPAAPRVVAIPTGSHPDALLLNKAQSILYVANAQDDTVSVVDTAADGVTQTISLRPSTKNGRMPGVSPTGLALSTDENTLYVTLGDMNAVGVIDLKSGKVKGYIPAGWYPTAVAATGDGALLVTNAKGVNAINPNPGHVKPTPASPNRYEDTFYDEAIIEGTVSRIPLSEQDLAAETKTVLADNDLAGTTPTPLPRQILGLRGIKHVIYIIKENRTYDQILGDMPQGNGDPELAIFGQQVTPNEHALAQRFVLLDNFYDCAEVSADGWNWSTQGIANEYVIKNVPYNYSGRGRGYDFEGQDNGYPVAGFPAKDADGEQSSVLFPNGAPPIPDISAAANGHLWDDAKRGGLSYRNYGFFLTEGQTGAVPQNGKSNLIPDNYPSAAGLQPGGHYAGGKLDPAVNGHTDIDFRQFDLDYPDSDGPKTGYRESTYGKFHAPDRFAEWNREFQLMLKEDPTGKSVPNLMLVRFMSDHTAGYKLGQATPAGHVADNDYSVGELVQAVSQSPIWNSTAIFVVEDDSQDGPDHVDCHRSTAFVISPWITQNSVDHHFYNTDSLLRTMELTLGLPPMSQYDAIAPPINDFASRPVNTAPYTVLPSAVIAQTAATSLPPRSPLWKLARMTAKMDFSREDLAPPQLLNEVIWQSVKGVQSPSPTPQHHVVLSSKSGKSGDDDDD